MKRGQLKRGKALEADLEKVRAFVQRGRSDLARSPLRSRPRRREREGPLSPREWHDAVFIAAHGRCAVSGETARDADDPRFHGHHCVPKRDLRGHGHRGLVWEPRNGVWLRADIHFDHEFSAFRSDLVPYTVLPRSVWDFCGELDALEGTHWATDLVRRLHPIRRDSGTT